MHHHRVADSTVASQSSFVNDRCQCSPVERHRISNNSEASSYCSGREGTGGNVYLDKRSLRHGIWNLSSGSSPQRRDARRRHYKDSPDKTSNFINSLRTYYAHEPESDVATPQITQDFIQARLEADYTDPVYSPLQKCGTTSVLGTAADGDVYAKTIFCGREWCPTCGTKGSTIHMQRVSRWYSKAQKITVIGYLVLEFKLDARDKLRNTDELRRIRLAVKRWLKRNGFERGLMRWHYFNDKNPGVYNPHLNILLDCAYIKSDRLEEIKKGLAKLLHQDMVIVNYQYSNKVNKKMHWLRYVTRPTFLDAEWDHELALEMMTGKVDPKTGKTRHFRTSSTWGKWDHLPVVWQLKTREGAALSKLAELDKKDIKWHKETVIYESYDRQTRQFYFERATRLIQYQTRLLRSNGFKDVAPGWLLFAGHGPVVRTPQREGWLLERWRECEVKAKVMSQYELYNEIDTLCVSKTGKKGDNMMINDSQSSSMPVNRHRSGSVLPYTEMREYFRRVREYKDAIRHNLPQSETHRLWIALNKPGHQKQKASGRQN